VPALEEPLRMIAENAGWDGAVAVARVREGNGNFGFDAETLEFGDMVKLGIIDPAKVVRVALQNATSVAGLLLTTEASVTELPGTEEENGGSARAGRLR